MGLHGRDTEVKTCRDLGVRVPGGDRDGHLGLAVRQRSQCAQRVAAASGRTVLCGDMTKLAPVTTAPFEIHAIGFYQGRVYFSSRAHGLFAVDQETNKAVPVRPSLMRVHVAPKSVVLKKYGSR